MKLDVRGIYRNRFYESFGDGLPVVFVVWTSSGKYGIGLHSIDGRTNCIVRSCVFVVMLHETRNFTYL